VDDFGMTVHSLERSGGRSGDWDFFVIESGVIFCPLIDNSAKFSTCLSFLDYLSIYFNQDILN
jgi:hypothetical protein